MKDKIGKIINSKYFDIIFVILINVIFFVLCNSLFTPKYEQIDDFMIMNLISKADGFSTLYGVQIHPLICGIIILLYKTAININWYTVFMLAMQFISFTIIGTVLLKKNKSIGIPLYIALIFMLYSKMLCYIQYTTISMLCITAGFILLMYSINEIKRIKKVCVICAILMFIIGCMIRFNTILIAVPFLALYFVCKILQDRDVKIIKIILILIIAIFITNISFTIFYNINPTYKEFFKFHEARSYLHDINILFYEESKEVFDNVEWSENDRDLFYGYLYGDEETFSPEKIETLKNNAIETEKDVDILEKLTDTINGFLIFINNRIYKYLFMLTVFAVIANNLILIIKNYKDKLDDKNDNIKISFINLTFLSMILMHCLFIFLNRPMFRVIIAIYILGTTILLYEFLEHIKINKNKFIRYLCVIGILIIGVLEFKENIYVGKLYDEDNYSVYNEIIEYTNSHKENAYLFSLAIHDRYLAYSIYEKIPDNTFSNIRALGDWDTYTENYYVFKDKYNIDNLLESLFQNDNVYLISGNVLWREDIEIVKQYIEEHHNIKVKTNVIKEFEKDIKIYKLEPYEEK